MSKGAPLYARNKLPLLMKRYEVRVEVKEFVSHVEIIDEPREDSFSMQAVEYGRASP